ncbi:hypothetical protein A5680_09690 [Mycobacterium sp. E2989]|nr:hypothetical protein A5680_09690 [Mycobacterium sp. E2989]
MQFCEHRGWLALPYRTFRAYCAAEFHTDGLRIPRQQRDAIVLSLTDAGESIRDIAAALTIDKNTVLAIQKRARQVSEIQTPNPKPAPSRKPPPYIRDFEKAAARIQDGAMALQHLIDDPIRFAAHKERLVREHRETILFAHQLIGKLLPVFDTEQMDLLVEGGA